MRSDPVIKEHFITDTQKRFEVIQLVEDAEPSVENLYNNMMASINETPEACIPKCAISKRRAPWENDTDYADDIALLSDLLTDAQFLLQRVEEAAKEVLTSTQRRQNAWPLERMVILRPLRMQTSRKF